MNDFKEQIKSLESATVQDNGSLVMNLINPSRQQVDVISFFIEQHTTLIFIGSEVDYNSLMGLLDLDQHEMKYIYFKDFEIAIKAIHSCRLYIGVDNSLLKAAQRFHKNTITI